MALVRRLVHEKTAMGDVVTAEIVINRTPPVEATLVILMKDDENGVVQSGCMTGLDFLFKGSKITIKPLINNPDYTHMICG